MWVPSILTIILFTISIILLRGKASFLIAGYNMLPERKKQKYNMKKLCRVVGGGSSVISVIFGIATYYRFEMPPIISWLIPWGVLATIAVVEILAITICRSKP